MAEHKHSGARQSLSKTHLIKLFRQDLLLALELALLLLQPPKCWDYKCVATPGKNLIFTCGMSEPIGDCAG